MPFNHIFGNSSGKYYLCCHTTDRDSFTTDWNFKDHLPFEYFDSKDMNDIRDKMLKGIRVPECRVCYDKEDKGVISDRQRYEKVEHIKRRTDKRNVELKISIHGNWCNLSCIMCAPAHSTERTREIKHNPDLMSLTDWSFVGKQYKINSGRFNDMVDNILDNIDRVVNLQFSTDGEPLQNPRFYHLLQKIPDDQAKHIDVSVTTNLSKDGLDEERNIGFVQRKFKSLGLRVSCDHYGTKYDWIRYKGDHHALEENLLNNRSCIYRISPAVSVLNVADMLEAEEYYEGVLNKNIFGSSYSYVKSPAFLNPCLHPRASELADEFVKINKWKSLGQQIHYWLDKTDAKQMKDLRLKMIKYFDTVSEYRGDWKELWNDLQI